MASISLDLSPATRLLDVLSGIADGFPLLSSFPSPLDLIMGRVFFDFTRLGGSASVDICVGAFPDRNHCRIPDIRTSSRLLNIHHEGSSVKKRAFDCYNSLA